MTIRLTQASIARVGVPESARPRKGVLLLIVLSMLTLFMMLGVTFLVASSRARLAARAYAQLTMEGGEARVPGAGILDSLLLQVVRGPLVIPGSGAFESLLADKYGPSGSTLRGTVSGLTQTGPVLTGTLTTAGTSLHPTDLAGRVLTLSQPGQPVSSHRIVRAGGSGTTTNAPTDSFDLVLDIPQGNMPFTFSGGTARAIVNGREFAGEPPGNEPWDGFDGNNLFLAQLRSSTASISRADVVRGSFLEPASAAHAFVIHTSATTSGTYTFVSSATSATVSLITAATDFPEPGLPLGDLIIDAADNDGDGVIDGVFQDFGLPNVTDGAGNTVQLRASVLVVDLDGRFNVNAHGSMTAFVYSDDHPGWPNPTNRPPNLKDAPMGSGFGPAEVNGKAMFLDSPLQGTAGLNNKENPVLMTMTGSPLNKRLGKRSGSSGSRYADDENTLLLRYPEGRYGERAAGTWTNIEDNTIAAATPNNFARPGIPGTDDETSRLIDRRAVASEPATISYGIPAVWWTGTSSFNWGSAGANYPLPRGVFNSPPDLHGRMKTLTLSASNSAVIPTVAFAQPEWSTPTAQNETRDDPYELLLDTRRGRGGMVCDPSTGGSATTTSSINRDNPFTPAELEAVLRPYDVDTNRLPPRLAAMLGSAAEESRLKITTDSWDTTAITGSAAIRIFGSGTFAGWLQRPALNSLTLSGSTPLSGLIGGEVARGERFDLNRALAASGTSAASYSVDDTYWVQRQAYFKDLYTLLVMLSSTSGTTSITVGGNTLKDTAATATLAQWAANVVDFRDADSTITRFDYDDDPSDGWTPTQTVWGSERPELVITETSAWEDDSTGELFIMLHRPWHAVAYASGSMAIPGEPVDTRLAVLMSGTPTNDLDLGKKTGLQAYSDAATYPLWRLRIVDDANPANEALIRFDIEATASTDGFAPATNSESTTPRLGTDSWLCVMGANTLSCAIPTGEQTVLTGTTGSVVVSGSLGTLRVPGSLPADHTQPIRPATIYVERLSDPLETVSESEQPEKWTAPQSADTVPMYRVVDQAPIQVVNRRTDPITGLVPPNREPTVIRRKSDSLWKQAFEAPVTMSYSLDPNNLKGGSPLWLPWLNRPFVSAAELLLVPRAAPDNLLADYDGSIIQSGSCGLAAVADLPQVLFDAVHVPTRFAGIHQTYDEATAGDLSGKTGIFSTAPNAITTVNQLSSFREPGRVNLNTVASEDVWNSVVAGPLRGPVQSGTGAGLGLSGTATTEAKPATSMYGLLCLSGSPTTIVSDTTTIISGTRQAQETNVLAYDKNPIHEIYTATRLANTTTPRSNVFGVWITLRQSIPNDPDSVKFHRAFYIVDRSIPVGFEEGQDHNVWDCVRLRRIIE